VVQLVEELPYKPEGRGFNSRRSHCLSISGRTNAMESTHPLTEVSTRSISWGGKGGWRVELIKLTHVCSDYQKNFWELQTPGEMMVCPGLEWNNFNFAFLSSHGVHPT